jgi:hypothetical protein
MAGMSGCLSRMIHRCAGERFFDLVGNTPVFCEFVVRIGSLHLT